MTEQFALKCEETVLSLPLLRVDRTPQVSGSIIFYTPGGFSSPRTQDRMTLKGEGQSGIKRTLEKSVGGGDG